MRLYGSVGLGGLNRVDDTRTVQRLLIVCGFSPGTVDGRCGRLTVGAIVDLQEELVGRPDGRVDVGGPSWRRLLGNGSPVGHPARPPAERPALPQSSAAGGSSARGAPAARPAPPRHAPAAPPPVRPAGRLRFTDMMPLPARSTYNHGLRSAPNSVLTQKFGMPRQSFAQDCRDPTMDAFARHVVTEDVGPFRARGPRQAIQSLGTVFAEVRRDYPELHNILTTAGMLCCRYQRGSNTAISTTAGEPRSISASLARWCHEGRVALHWGCT